MEAFYDVRKEGTLFYEEHFDGSPEERKYFAENPSAFIEDIGLMTGDLIRFFGVETDRGIVYPFKN